LKLYHHANHADDSSNSDISAEDDAISLCFEQGDDNDATLPFENDAAAESEGSGDESNSSDSDPDDSNDADNSADSEEENKGAHAGEDAAHVSGPRFRSATSELDQPVLEFI